MHKSALFFFIYCLIGLDTPAQITVKGIILGRTNHSPIPYANIGVVNHNIGTLSNTDGSFTITIAAGLKNDSISFSSVGFADKKIAITFFRTGKADTVYLIEKSKLLPAVVVTSAKQKKSLIEIGNIAVRGGSLEADTTYAGRTIALLIDNKTSKLKTVVPFPGIVEEARLRIFRNNLRSFKVRVRLLELDSVTNLPGKDLLNESIVKQSSMKKGWLSFDLSDYRLELSRPFFLAFEQISELQDRIDITNGYHDYISRFPKKLKTDTVEYNGQKEVRRTLAGGIDLPGTFIAFSNSESRKANFICYLRETSFSEWKKTFSIPAATVTLSVTGAGMAAMETDCAANDPACKAAKFTTDFMEESGITGMQVRISKKGETVWSKNIGYADAANKITVSDTTLFRINSISKSMTSLALIKLVAAGKLDLDAPVQKYVPGFPLKAYPVSTRQLAGHLAGFRDYNEADITDYIRQEHYNSATDALAVFRNDTLLFKPGSQFSYSSFGWNLAAAVIEGAAGEGYEEYMKKEIWRPMDMRHTYVDDVRLPDPNRSKFYDAAGEENDLGDLSYKYASGGLLSTTEDLLKFGNQILHGKLIDPKLKQLLFETQYTADGKPTGYGLGWYTGKDEKGRRIWYHAGDSFSSSSCLIIYPNDDLVVAFLANGQEGVNFNLRKLAEIFLTGK